MTDLTTLPNFRTSQLDIPAILDGRDGRNRAQSNRPQIAAQDDISAIRAWLARYLDSKNTFDNYRKEVERLWLWATQELRKPLSSLTHDDFLRYRAFLQNPGPNWVVPGGRRVRRDDPAWRPFAGPLSPASIRQAEIILNALFSWLVQAGYLEGNPLSLSRRRRKGAPPHTSRYLSLDQWRRIIEAVETLSDGENHDPKTYARARWIVRLFYLTGMRISEVCENTMGRFEARQGHDGRRRWFITVTGKGNKDRVLPVTRELLDELEAYRLAMGLSKHPIPGEDTPLVQSLRRRAPSPITRSAMHHILKQLFAIAQSLASPDEAVKLGQASAHWLRHTRGSHMANAGMPLKSVQTLLGHASLETTGIYLHGEDDDLHDETERVDKTLGGG